MKYAGFHSARLGTCLADSSVIAPEVGLPFPLSTTALTATVS